MPKRARPSSSAAPPPEPDDDDDDFFGHDGLPKSLLDSCLKLEVTHCEPNYSLPWQMRHQTSSTSTGFIISGERILTNAHCVDNFAVVKVKKRGEATKYLAEVVAIGRDCDLALLSVRDRDFWKKTSPIVVRDAMVQPQEEVTVVGFPVGGDNMSITAGVVSRIDMQEYTHGCPELLVVQIDAAINPGNSGGPAFSAENECVGVAFQSLKDASLGTENIGYIIPTCVINHFLDDVAKHGRYTGFVDLGIELQRCENPAVRAVAGLTGSASGLMVKKLHPMCPLRETLRKGDVITHVDGVAIASDGTVPFRRGERIYFSYLLSHKFVGESAKLRALRAGKPLPPLSLVLGETLLLVPVDSGARRTRSGSGACRDLRAPSYAIFGGLVFTQLCEPYLKAEWGDDFDARAPLPLLERWQYGLREAATDQVVVLSQVLAHPSNVGYEHLVNVQLKACNGEPVRNLKHLVQLVEQSKERFVRFEVGPHDELVALEAKALGDVTAEILRSHSIAKPRSDDLL